MVQPGIYKVRLSTCSLFSSPIRQQFLRLTTTTFGLSQLPHSFNLFEIQYATAKMQFSHIIALLAATAAYALPQGAIPAVGETSPSANDNQANVCGNGNKLSCCNSQSNGSLVNVLGSLCSLQVPVIGVPLQSTCGAQQPMCCSTNQHVRLQPTFLD